ncbi:MAG: cytochrome C oxidase subunit IV family protein [Pirellulales bacterium]|nr:cytochrome C oxidase subunit IV family protein [Pirellulales bacterium]
MTDHSTHPVTTEDAAREAEHYGHIMPLWVLAGVLLTLVVLTVATVAATWVDLEPWNLAIALGIATVKAALVVLYFMHLRYDHPFNALVFVTALLFLAMFLGGALTDTIQYQPDIESYRESRQM